MKFGIRLPIGGAHSSKKAILETAQMAEDEGFDSVSVVDHILVSKQSWILSPLYEALSTLAFVAGATKHVRLITSVIVLPMRNPIVFAKQVATIDVLSEGRLLLGVGVGWLEEEFNFLGADFSLRGRIADEWIRVLRVLWREQSPSFKGKYFSFSDTIFEPKPAQKDGPPIWIGGVTDAAIKRAAKLGDGWYPINLSLQQFEQGAKKLRSLTSRKITLALDASVNLRSPEKEENIQRSKYFSGKVNNICNILEEYSEKGLEYFVALFPFERDKLFSQAKLFAKEVIPSFSE